MFLRNFFTAETKTTDIEEEIAAFEKNWSALKSIDQKIGAASGLDALFWLSSSGIIHMVVNIAFSAAIYLYVTQYANRQETAAQFHTQLHKLVNHYRSYRNSDPKITNDPVFKKVMKAIAPFVSTEELFLWDLNDVNPKDLSAEFIAEIAKPPHNKKVVMLGGPKAQPQEAQQTSRYSYYFGFFEQPFAEIKRALYRHRESIETNDQEAKVRVSASR